MPVGGGKRPATGNGKESIESSLNRVKYLYLLGYIGEIRLYLKKNYNILFFEFG